MLAAVTFADAIGLRQYLTGYAYRLTHSWADAEDLVQSTMLRAWAARESFRYEHEGALKAWLKRILFNVHVTPYSHPKSVQAVRLPQHFVHEAYPCAGSDACELAEFYDAIELLSPEHQSTLLLARAGYGYDEIAVSTGVALGTVKSRVNRAETALRRALLEPKRAHQSSLRTRNQQRVNAATPALDGQAAAGALGVEV